MSGANFFQSLLRQLLQEARRNAWKFHDLPGRNPVVVGHRLQPHRTTPMVAPVALEELLDALLFQVAVAERRKISVAIMHLKTNAGHHATSPQLRVYVGWS